MAVSPVPAEIPSKPIQALSGPKPVGQTESRTASTAAEALTTEFPEGILLGSKKIDQLSPPTRLPGELVDAIAKETLDKNQVSGELSFGLEAVASARLNPRFNRLLRSFASEPRAEAPLLPEPEVCASGHVSIIFTQDRATIVGLEGEDPVQFQQNLERTHPEIALRLKAMPKDHLSFVIRKEEQTIIQAVDSKLALMATELREGLSEAVSEPEEAPAEPEEETHEEEEVEKKPGVEALAAVGPERAVLETPTSVLAAAVNDVFTARILSATSWLQRAAARVTMSWAHRQADEARKVIEEKQREKEEIRRENIKEDVKHYEQTKNVVKSDQTRSDVRRERAVSGEAIAFGIAQGKEQAGEPSPPISPKTSR